MTVIVFLIDTSASMMQKTYLGTTYLDFARLAVEQFLKQRQRDPNSKGDRYMLMTFDEYPINVKAGWKESQAIFTEQLKNLRAGGLCNFGTAVDSVLRFVNLNRMQTGIEYYGYGRYPCFSEHVVIVSITDGANISSSSEINFARQVTIGSELTVEPFRWDHRLFSLVLRFPGYQMGKFGESLFPDLIQSNSNNGVLPIQPQTFLHSDDGPLQTLCSAMGGRSFCISSHRVLTSSIDAIIQKIQRNGVMIQLEKYGTDPPSPLPALVPKYNNGDSLTDLVQTSVGENVLPVINAFDGQTSTTFPINSSWKSQAVMLILKPNKQGQGHWPIPEAFSVDSISSTLPSRLARPVVLFRCEASEPLINQEFPFDKYELEHSPLSQYILERKEPNVCWQVFVENSSRFGGIGYPFGYLKTSSNLQSVILFLMPYNYPALLPLLEEAKDIKVVNSSGFRQRMEKYLLTIPPYYYSPMKKAFKRINLLVSFLEDYNQPIYSYGIVGLMTKMKHLGKEEFDLACATVAKNLENFPPALINGPQFIRASHCRVMNPLKNSIMDCKLQPFLQPFFSVIPPLFKDIKICVGEAVRSGITPLVIPSAQFKNPFDIDRKSVISQLDKMRVNFDQQVETNALHVLEGGMPGQKIKLQHAEDLHNQLISKMGDYQEYMRCLSSIGAAPLRELEPQAARPHAFGNPFKLDKKSIAIDEVGEVNTSSSTGNATMNDNSGNNERRSKDAENRVKSSGFSSVSGDLATSFSSVPVAIRTKRKPGPLDPNLLTSWKRRRSSSMTSDFSDTSSVCSEFTDFSSTTNDVSEITDEDCETGKNFEDNNFEQSVFLFNSDDIEPALIIYENGSNKKDVSEKVPVNGVLSSNLLYKEPLNNTSQKLFNNECKTLAMHNNFLINGTKKISSLTASQICHKQLELSKFVRSVGDRHTVFGNCMNVVKDVVNDNERQFLISFALCEARRFKRAELMKRFDHELRLISSTVA